MHNRGEDREETNVPRVRRHVESIESLGLPEQRLLRWNQRGGRAVGSGTTVVGDESEIDELLEAQHSQDKGPLSRGDQSNQLMSQKFSEFSTQLLYELAVNISRFGLRKYEK